MTDQDIAHDRALYAIEGHFGLGLLTVGGAGSERTLTNAEAQDLAYEVFHRAFDAGWEAAMKEGA